MLLATEKLPFTYQYIYMDIILSQTEVNNRAGAGKTICLLVYWSHDYFAGPLAVAQPCGRTPLKCFRDFF
jgi:hypothetical protein